MINNYIKKTSKEKFFFEVFPSALTILLPFFLITGPFLPDLAISLCAVIFISNTIRGPFVSFRNYYKSTFFICFTIFWITIVSSSLLSSDVFYSLETSFFYIRFGFFALSTWFLLKINPKIIIYFFYVLIFCFLILICDGFFQFYSKENIFGWPIIETRISSFFKEELILGSYLSRLLPLYFATLIFILQDSKKYFFKLVFFVTIFVLTEVLVFFSGERAAFFYINLSAIFILILSNQYKLLRVSVLFISFSLIIIISLFDNQYKSRIVDFTLDQINASTSLNRETKKYYIFSLEHENHYKSAMLMFNDNKIIGIGPRLFRKNCDKKEYIISFESCTTHPHNTYVQLLAEVGILGFAQIFLYFVIFLYISSKHLFLKFKRRKILLNDFQIALLSGAVITLWPFVPTGNFFSNWLNVVYYLPVGFLLFSLDTKNND